MGMAKLQIWITAEGDPCNISERDEHDNTPWEVAIMHCDGRVLQWCGRRYFGLVARCGHLEVEVPPGCYIVRAGEGMGVTTHGGLTGNHMSDHGVVTACCDQTTCITLFAPSAHSCVDGVILAMQRWIAADRLPAEIGNRALEALRPVLECLPRSNFDYAALRTMAELLKSADQPKPPTQTTKEF